MATYKAWLQVEGAWDYINYNNGSCQANNLHDAIMIFNDVYGKHCKGGYMEMHFGVNAGCLVFPDEKKRYIIVKVE